MDSFERKYKNSIIAIAIKKDIGGEDKKATNDYIRDKYHSMGYLTEEELRQTEDDLEFSQREILAYQKRLGKSYTIEGFVWLAIGLGITGAGYYTALPGEKYIATTGIILYGLYRLMKGAGTRNIGYT